MGLHKIFLTLIATAVFAVPTSAFADAVIIDFTTADNVTETTGDAIAAVEAMITFPTTLADPATVAVFETANLTGTPLTVTIESIFSTDTSGVVLNASSNNFGIQSDNDVSNTRLEAAFQETITISFNRDLFLQAIDFNGFSQDGEQFLINDLIIGQDGATGTFANENEGDDGADLTLGGTTDGVFFAAGETIAFQASGTANAEVAIRDITVHVVPEAVPEPSSLALLGLLGGVAAIRRRR